MHRSPRSLLSAPCSLPARSLLTGLAALVIGAAAAGSAHAALEAERGTTVIAHDAASHTLTVRVRFATPQLSRDRAGELAVRITGLPNTIQAGMPSVPVQTVKVALPRGARLTATEVLPGAEQVGRGAVARNRSMVAYSWRETDHSGLVAEAPPRVPGERWPESRATSSVQMLHGVPVVVLDLHPVQVAPASGTYATVSEATVVLRYAADAPRSREMFAHEARQVAELVDNPEIVAAATGRARANTDGYDYLILSAAPFIGFAGPSGFADLQANLQARGYRSKVVDVATIPASIAAGDLAARIRAFIKAEYDRSGIRFVLLAADGDSSGPGAVIPARRFFGKVNSYDGSWHTIQNDIPADLYYGCLDGDFDGNHNGHWGEPTDGANGGDVDLLAEVAVGRMTLKTTADLQSFVRKTIAFATTARPKSVLLMGEELFAEMNLYGDDYMNQLLGACTDHGYQTQGYGADWSVDKLYDRGGGWTGATALAKLSGGDFLMVNHLGHSNTEYNMRMYSSRIAKMANVRPFFFYTQGCFPGDYTVNDCFIELLVRHGKGAVAAIANTCYGLGPEDPQPTTTTTPGASQMLHRRFVDYVLAHPQDSLARANQASKEAFLGLASAPEMRWVFWDATFFGDPSLRLAQ